MRKKNIFEDIPEELPEEIFETLFQGSVVKVERIVSKGHMTPKGQWYDQDEHEWVLLLSGEAKLCFADAVGLMHLKAGDYVNIPAHRKHRVEWTAAAIDTVWLAIFYR